MADPTARSAGKLREFSQQLAERLKAAPVRGRETTRLAVRIAGHHFLLPLAAAGEIVTLEEVASVPWTRPWYRGLAKVRGRLVSVIDLLQFLGRSPRVREDTGQLLVLGDALDANVAFLITRAFGLRDIGQLQPGAEEAPRSRWEIAAYRDEDGNDLIELDVAGLAASDSFNLVSL